MIVILLTLLVGLFATRPRANPGRGAERALLVTVAAVLLLASTDGPPQVRAALDRDFILRAYRQAGNNVSAGWVAGNFARGSNGTCQSNAVACEAGQRPAENAAAETHGPVHATPRPPAPAGRSVGAGAARSGHPHDALRRSVQRVRQHLVMRDSDVIIVTFPKSGTHWLTSVMSRILYPSGTALNPFHPEDNLRAVLSPLHFFQNLPVFWLLPPGVDKGTGAEPAEVTDAAFDIINSMPTSSPRIFLSHMPVDLFEYRPTSRTKILYLLREPHAVWFSLYKWLGRLFAMVDDMPPEQRKTEKLGAIDPNAFALEFLAGQVLLPPRLREFGPDFAWHKHVRGWWDVVQARAAAGSGITTVVNFDAAMQAPVATVQALAAACNATGWAARRGEEMAVAEAVVSDTTFQALRQRLQEFQGGELNSHTGAHFPNQSFATKRAAWRDTFASVEATTQRSFNYTTRLFRVITARRPGRVGGGVVLA